MHTPTRSSDPTKERKKVGSAMHCKDDAKGTERWRSRVWQSLCRACLQALPKRALTTVAGHFLRSRQSRLLIRGFARAYGISLAECELSWRDYPSLAAFFARRLRTGLRMLEGDDADIACPVDGVISQIGTIEQGSALQVKGHPYAVSALLAQSAQIFEGGQYVTIYLSPSDYHRIHAPLRGVVQRAVHVPGTLFPVNRLGSQTIAGLFTKNERVVTWLAAGTRVLALAAVGSFVVGSVRLCDALAPDERRQRHAGAAVDLMRKPVTVLRGEELGWFEFGSTVVLLFAPQQARLCIMPGQRVKALAKIGRWLD